MKKNILITILVLITVTSLLYGYSQHSRAERMRELADMNAMKARELMQMAEAARLEAERQRLLAYENAQMAKEYAQRAGEQLKKGK